MGPLRFLSTPRFTISRQTTIYDFSAHHDLMISQYTMIYDFSAHHELRFLSTPDLRFPSTPRFTISLPTMTLVSVILCYKQFSRELAWRFAKYIGSNTYTSHSDISLVRELRFYEHEGQKPYQDLVRKRSHCRSIRKVIGNCRFLNKNQMPKISSRKGLLQFMYAKAANDITLCSI